MGILNIHFYIYPHKKKKKKRVHFENPYSRQTLLFSRQSVRNTRILLKK